jgi:imidazolonepropionase-like amidohydrolase
LALAVGVSGFAQAAQESASRLTLISNVDIFDGQTATLLKNRHVLVKGNRIETVSNEPLAVIQTDNVTMIDGGGRVLMPGMIDAHWHALFATIPMPKLLQSELSYLTIVAARANRDALMRGFTTVRRRRRQRVRTQTGHRLRHHRWAAHLSLRIVHIPDRRSRRFLRPA